MGGNEKLLQYSVESAVVVRYGIKRDSSVDLSNVKVSWELRVKRISAIPCNERRPT